MRRATRASCYPALLSTSKDPPLLLPYHYLMLMMMICYQNVLPGEHHPGLARGSGRTSNPACFSQPVPITELVIRPHANHESLGSESVSIPKNPRTDRPVGYAFVDLSTPTEAERAIAELSGKEVLERKVSVQLARKPEPAAEKVEGANGEGSGEGARRRQSTRGRGRAGRGRAGRARGGRAGEGVSYPLKPTSMNVWLTPG